MNLLGAKLYDPSSAVTNKATSALLAMTAFDTTNLRLTVTVPAHGMVRFRIRCGCFGATTCPRILLGVLNGSSVVGRVTPAYENATANAATQGFLLDAEFTATGLTPGSTSFDAAYGVEIVVASTNIKYGGPNNTTTDDAWGAFQFEAWDPQPLTLALDGAVNVKQWNGTNVSTPATAGIPDVNVKNMNNVSGSAITTIKAVQGLATDGVVPTVTTLTNLPAITSNWLTAAGIAASALNGKGDWNIGKTGYALSAAGVQAIWDALTSALTTVGSIGKLLVDNINATISSRSTYAGTDTSGTTTLLSRLTSGRATNLDNLDATVSSRHASGAAVASVTGNVGGNVAGNVNGSVGSVAGSVAGSVQSVTDPVIVGEISAAAIGDFFNVDSGLNFGDAVGHSVIKEIARGIWEEDVDSHATSGTFGGEFVTLADLGNALVDERDPSALAVWAAASRTLSAFAFTVNTNANATETAIKAKTDNLPASPAASSDIPTVGAIADAVWDETASDHQADDTFGQQIVVVLGDGVESIAGEVATIRGKTNQLTFTHAGEVDANIHSVNDVAVTGDGSEGTEWGPDV